MIAGSLVGLVNPWYLKISVLLIAWVNELAAAPLGRMSALTRLKETNR
jgi:hypothetical protein